MTAWQQARLADVADINPRFEYRGGPSDPASFVRMAHVSAEAGAVIDEEARSVEEVARGYTAFNRGDILVAKITPCFENGKIAEATIRRQIGFGSTEFHVIRPHRAILDHRFLLHFLRQPRIRVEGEQRMTGSGGQRRVPTQFLQDLSVPLAPIAEQRRIAEVLDRAEALRANRRETVARLDELTRASFREWFGDPIANTGNWPTEALGNLCRVIRGASPRPAGDPRYFGGTIPWLKISDVTAARGMRVDRIRETVTEAGRDRSVYVDAGTLILTNSATVGIPKFLAIGSCIHDGFLALLDIDPRVDRNFLYMLLLTIRPYLASLAPEGTQKNLNTGLAKAIPVILPPLAQQRQFASLLARSEDARRAQDDHAAGLGALQTSLQQRAFAGKL